MTWKMNRNEAKDLLRRWGNTSETIQYLELREALRHAAGEGTGEIGGQIRQATAFEARMDEWMDGHITTREAKVMLLRYGGKKKWGEIAQETGMSEEEVRKIDKQVAVMLMETWEEE